MKLQCSRAVSPLQSCRNDDGDDRVSQQRRLPKQRTALLDVSIAIVSWNVRDTLRVCPRSF